MSGGTLRSHSDADKDAGASVGPRTVRVIRGEQDTTYVIAEERDDGSLLLRPEAPDRAEPGPGSAVTVGGDAVGTGSEPARDFGPSPSIILDVRDLSVAYGARKA